MKLNVFVMIISLFSFASCSHQSSYSGHGEGSVSQKDLDKYAPKAIDADLARKIQNILDLRSPNRGEIDRNAKTIAFNWNVTGNTQVWVMNTEGGFPVQVTGGEEAAFLSGMSADGRTLFISRDNKGDEYHGLYMMELDGDRTLVPIHNPNRVTVGLQYVSKDGLHIYYYANDIKSSDYAIYRFNLKKKERELVYNGKGFWRLSDSNDKGKLILSKIISNVHSEHYLFDEKTKELTPLLGTNEVEEYRVSFSKKDGEYIVRTSKFGEFKRLYLYQSKNKKFTPITEDRNADISSYSLSPDKSRLVYTINEKGALKAEARETESFKKISLPFEKTDLSVSITSTYSARHSLISTLGYDTPMMHYLYDHNTKKLRPVSAPSVPEISVKNFTQDKLEYYTAKDGTQIPMWVKRSKECEVKVCPVIVNFHGGPEAEASPGFDAIVELYTERGFVFVRPNVRGSSGHGKSWLTADDGPKRLDVVSDIEDVAIFIKKNWAKNGVVPKIGVSGGSYGGYSTYMAMTKFAGAYDAGVSSVGMSSLVTFLQNTADYRRALRESEYGSLEHDMDALIKLSPITYIDRIKSPLLIIHGAMDPRVPAGEALQFFDHMKKKKIEGDLILFPDEGHGVRKRANRVLNIGHTIEFFEKHLK
jgi:dipeptidyl aminopeptidase/acylaminoacyl peptidase